MSSLKQQAATSVIWSAVERFSVQGIQYLITIIIARILLPSDYGLVAMLGIFIAISQTFIDGGFANALIQKKDREQVDYSTVFYFNIVLALLLYGALFFASPLIASFYDEPKLELLAKVIGLILIINSFGIVQQAKLTIVLDFKRLAMASLVAVITSGVVSVWLAYNGFGVWTLVWHVLLNNFLRVVLIWIFARWKPSLQFSTESFSRLFSFGSKLLLSSLLHTIYTNLYSLVIGKKFAKTELGYFNQASTLAQFPSTNMTNVIVRAIYPIQCKMQDNAQQLNRLFIIYLRMACYIIFPVMVWLCVIAEPLIKVLLTDKWLPSVPFFQILCLAYMWDPVMKINNNMLNVLGRSDYFLRAEVIKKIVAIGILVITIPFGIYVMCIGLIIYSMADMVIIIYYSHRLTRITLWDQLKTIAPVTALSATMGAIVYGVIALVSNPILELVLGALVGGGFYLGVSYILKFKELRDLLSMVGRKI